MKRPSAVKSQHASTPSSRVAWRLKRKSARRRAGGEKRCRSVGDANAWSSSLTGTGCETDILPGFVGPAGPLSPLPATLSPQPSRSQRSEPGVRNQKVPRLADEGGRFLGDSDPWTSLLSIIARGSLRGRLLLARDGKSAVVWHVTAQSQLQPGTSLIFDRREREEFI